MSSRLLVTLTLLGSLGLSQPARAEYKDGALVTAMESQFKSTKNWALKAIILLALGDHFHPNGGEMVQTALEDKDRRLRAYGLETLKRANDDTLGSICDGEMMEVLIRKRLKDRNEKVRATVLEILARVRPDAGNDSAGKWSRWWSKNKKGFMVKPFNAPPSSKPAAGGGNGSVQVRFIKKAFAVSQAGVELVICIDNTGSMGSPISACAEAMKDLVALLKGVSPRFRCGLVTYNDPQTNVETPLTHRVDQMDEQLGRVKAYGGGDFPEAVMKGLEQALDVREMGWTAKTNKFVLIVGDAPAHPHELEKAKELAKKAYEKNKEADEKQQKLLAVTGGGKIPAKKLPVRGITISTLAVAHGGIAAPQTETDFKAIAEAGGGTYNVMDPANKDAAAKGVVELILKLSFGEEFAKEASAFSKIFQEYRGAGYFK